MKFYKPENAKEKIMNIKKVILTESSSPNEMKLTFVRVKSGNNYKFGFIYKVCDSIIHILILDKFEKKHEFWYNGILDDKKSHDIGNIAIQLTTNPDVNSTSYLMFKFTENGVIQQKKDGSLLKAKNQLELIEFTH